MHINHGENLVTLIILKNIAISLVSRQKEKLVSANLY